MSVATGSFTAGVLTGVAVLLSYIAWKGEIVMYDGADTEITFYKAAHHDPYFDPLWNIKCTSNGGVSISGLQTLNVHVDVSALFDAFTCNYDNHDRRL